MSERISILLVIYNEKDHILFNRALRNTKEELDIHHVLDAQAAFDALNKEVYDCVLVDSTLPDTTVNEFINDLQINIPVIVLTDLSCEDVGIKALREGAQDYLVKNELSGSLIVRSIRYAIERQRMASALYELDLLDEMTGLYNKKGFMLFANQQIKHANRSRKKMCLLVASCDNKHYINDTFGRYVGDGVILEMAEFLEDIFRSSDLICRLGSDEFAALALEVDDECQDKIIERLEAKVEERNEQENSKFQLVLRMGTAVYDPFNQSSIEELLEKAESQKQKSSVVW